MFTLPGGMIYVGEYLPSPTGWNEPSLIVPSRRVNRKNPDRTGQQVHYRLAYESMARASRGAYLEWLAEGRRNPSTSGSYALLFLCGLERRVFVDIAEDEASVAELPALRAEAAALLDTYGDRDYTFHNRATEFISLIELLTADPSNDELGDPPPLAAQAWSVPLGLRIGLGRCTARRQPLPVTVRRSPMSPGGGCDRCLKGGKFRRTWIPPASAFSTKRGRTTNGCGWT